MGWFGNKIWHQVIWGPIYLGTWSAYHYSSSLSYCIWLHINLSNKGVAKPSVERIVKNCSYSFKPYTAVHCKKGTMFV